MYRVYAASLPAEMRLPGPVRQQSAPKIQYGVAVPTSTVLLVGRNCPSNRDIPSMQIALLERSSWLCPAHREEAARASETAEYAKFMAEAAESKRALQGQLQDSHMEAASWRQQTKVLQESTNNAKLMMRQHMENRSRAEHALQVTVCLRR